MVKFNGQQHVVRYITIVIKSKTNLYIPEHLN
ncbi:MAG: hypothetical protein UV73_C0005G0049 [Candidatus Gottesmanbacteria bacterium GW2011_GWA2_43_14]|uniref:Uncharacterized protein n=1 Tax=Candidatus Gottesmanbacteria bacterium GW2011_GWA2_43_14 TaxID=1618443 RepID=A0A0G1DJM3_9BACT|nr:MAG: hypothetical protein UV73_C0005G0049 [Candidatus Gottesmanbacteria bacterium GW2011_GWA2_43_14]